MCFLDGAQLFTACDGSSIILEHVRKCWQRVGGGGNGVKLPDFLPGQHACDVSRFRDKRVQIKNTKDKTPRTATRRCLGSCLVQRRWWWQLQRALHSRYDTTRNYSEFCLLFFFSQPPVHPSGTRWLSVSCQALVGGVIPHGGGAPEDERPTWTPIPMYWSCVG